MPPSQIQYRRNHNLLLLSKLLSLRDYASPFTLAVDSLEQSAAPLVREYVKRAKTTQDAILYISFETLRAPTGIETFIDASHQSLAELRKQIASSVTNHPKSLIIIDSLNSLAAKHPSELSSFLTSIIFISSSLLAVFHSHVPTSISAHDPYSPSPLTLLKYLATTIFITHSWAHVLARKAATDRSLLEPVFGLAEEKEGAVCGLGSNTDSGLVLEMEHRRKSGRGVRERFFLLQEHKAGNSGLSQITKPILLDDHPDYQLSLKDDSHEQGGDLKTTFNLALTDKQRRDRENIVLPYFDAQRTEGVGDGGRILYDMGSEDDFDEEEDEI